MADVFVESDPEQDVLRVVGALDAGVVDQLESELALCTTPGARPLVVDLDRVQVLSSAAIRTLRQALDRAEAAGVRASVRCRPGSVAHQVLALAAVPTGDQG